MAEENASTPGVTASWTKGEKVNFEAVPVEVSVYSGPGAAFLSLAMATATDGAFEHEFVQAVGGTMFQCRTTTKGKERVTAEVDLAPLMKAMATLNAEALGRKGGDQDGDTADR